MSVTMLPTARPRPARAAGGATGPLLAAPAGLLLAALILLPTAGVLLLSLFDWDLGARSLRFVGFGNFARLLQDAQFWAALANTLLFASVVTPVTLALGLALALLIERTPSLRPLYRAVHLLPVLAAFPAMAMAWEVLLHPTLGPADWLLRAAGLAPLNWLHDRVLVLPTLMAIGVWHHLGLAVILFIGGLKNIPRDLQEAAELDGAQRPLDRLRLVILPGIAPVALFVAVLIALRALSLFDEPRILTHGGPGFASESLLHTLFVESFVHLQTGFGAALTAVFLALTAGLALLRQRLERRVHYQ